MSDQRRRRGVRTSPRDTGAEDEETEHPELQAPRASASRGSPEGAAMSTFVLGGVVGATSLGLFAISLEQGDHGKLGSTAAQVLWGAILLTTAAQAGFWALLVRAALSLPAARARVLLLVSSLAPSALVVSGILGYGLRSPRPSLFPWAGAAFAVFLSPVLLLSFAPVLALARRVRAGDTGADSRDVAAAGFAWAAAVAALGLVLAPALGFGAISASALIVAVVSLERACSRVLPSDDDASRARPPTRARLFRALRLGGSRVALVALILVPLRVHERVGASNPAIRAIYEQGLAMYERVRPAGREGDVSLWVIDHGGYTGPPIGWDERAHVLLRDEQLFERVPRLRSVPPYSTSRPR